MGVAGPKSPFAGKLGTATTPEGGSEPGPTEVPVLVPYIYGPKGASRLQRPGLLAIGLVAANRAKAGRFNAFPPGPLRHRTLARDPRAPPALVLREFTSSSAGWSCPLYAKMLLNTQTGGSQSGVGRRGGQSSKTAEAE